MKLNRLFLNIVRKTVLKDVARRRKLYPPHGLYTEFLNIPFIDDGLINHQYAVYLAKERHKKCCVIDVHGGSYMFCDHTDNYYIATKFLDRGFDFVTIDYLPNDGNRDTFDLVDDCVKCINHLFTHLKDYDLERDSFFLMGDSAGGHFALLLTELFNNKKLQDELNLHLPDIKIKGVLVNSPVYDFANTGKDNLTKGAMKRMFGKNYSLEKMEKLSPKTYIDSLIKTPVFLSTCKNDFLRFEPLKLKHDLEERNAQLKFIDMYTNQPNVVHVHNVIYPEMYESKYVNHAMVDFMISLL